ncbi:hypothetical protein [Devosia aurantiaca]|uniref:Uncharacterized protein n=1 Tax=Devosia aurantiaca TaxID=2714858 RepID=A0A6M1SQS1_9HYPH|nr:hypothetical protein [Devosia aurantiaca]NGP18906.1 hypothetical protein [Devosia aurantiaca]
MLAFYRGHVIVFLGDSELSAEIMEQSSSAPLPTKVSATLEKGEAVCLERAKALIDLYLLSSQDDPKLPH